MAFNSTKFMKQEFQPRTEAVEVPALSAWFDKSDDGEPVSCAWKVRGLTASELAKIFEASNKAKNFDSIVQAIASSKAKIDELKEVLGIGNDVPADVMKRLEQLTLGSVEPEIDTSVAVKLAEKFPIEFYMLTNKITVLTGLGMDVKK